MQFLSSFYDSKPIEEVYKSKPNPQAENSRTKQSKGETDLKIKGSVKQKLIVQAPLAVEKEVMGRSSLLKKIQLLEAKKDRTLLENYELMKAKYDEAILAAADAESALTKIKKNVCGFADINGLSKYSNDTLLHLIKARLPENTYENVYVTKEPYTFEMGVKQSRKIELLRSESFIENVAVFFDMFAAFFSSIAVPESDFRSSVDGDSIADELLDAIKIGEEGLPAGEKAKIRAEKRQQITHAFRQWLSITIWVPEKCNYNAEVKLIHGSQIIRWAIAPGIILNNLIGRK